jgi:hypothetical protein
VLGRVIGERDGVAATVAVGARVGDGLAAATVGLGEALGLGLGTAPGVVAHAASSRLDASAAPIRSIEVIFAGEAEMRIGGTRLRTTFAGER